MDQAESIKASERAAIYSDTKLNELVDKLDFVKELSLDIVITGSFARMEAHEQSDLDYFILAEEPGAISDSVELERRIEKVIAGVVINKPKPGGAWGSFDTISNLDINIGGNEESNNSFTRRILYLIESKSLFDSTIYRSGKLNIINRYVSESTSNHQLGMFYLNDLIRYYRTMCVDFEHKTFEKGRPWGLANIKLVYSRKLLYFSGFLIAAEMYQRTWKKKRVILDEYSSLSPFERVRRICGSYAEPLLSEYEEFLDFMSNGEKRRILEDRDIDDLQKTDEFLDLKNRSHHFTDRMISCLQSVYSSSHPIHRALII